METATPDTGRVYGYARVSTGKQGQSLEHQVAELIKAGVRGEHDVFTDNGVSGRKAWSNREGLSTAISVLHPGDTLAVTALDRLGRSSNDVISLTKRLADEGIHLLVLNLGGSVGRADTREYGGKVLLQVLAVLAEMESDIRSQRAKAGHKSRAQRGNSGGGRSQKHSDGAIRKAAARIRSGGETVTDVAKSMEISKATLYRRAKELGESLRD